MLNSSRLFRARRLTGTTSLALLTTLFMPLQLFAQPPATHHHFKLIDLGTLGGPNSAVSGPDSQILNDMGTMVAYSNTAAANPNPNCFLPLQQSNTDCFVERPVVRLNGTVRDLGVLPGGTNGQTDAIANNGLIVGWSEDGRIDPLLGLPEAHAVLWTRGGQITDLGALAGNESLATAVNSRGQVVGFSNNDILEDPAISLVGLPTQTRAFLWQHGAMQDLGTLGGTDSLAALINERGQVAGFSYTNSTPNQTTGKPTQDPFFWEDGHMVDIGTLGGTMGVPNWMNSRGQVVGISNVAGDQNTHAFFWDKKEGLKDLGLLPGGIYGNAMWINDAGEIVGGSDSSNGFHAVLWKKGVMIDLGNLAGDCGTQATSINSQGQIVGYGTSTIDCSSEAQAILFEDGGTPVDLNTLVVPGSAVTFLNAFIINDRGEIAGWGALPSGDERAILLIPCDENHPGVEGCDYGAGD